jgi:hypothetical protein
MKVLHQSGGNTPALQISVFGKIPVEVKTSSNGFDVGSWTPCHFCHVCSHAKLSPFLAWVVAVGKINFGPIVNLQQKFREAQDDWVADVWERVESMPIPSPKTYINALILVVFPVQGNKVHLARVQERRARFDIEKVQKAIGQM